MRPLARELRSAESISTMSLHTTFCAVLLAASLFGCAKQGEGERCDLNSGNLDCDTGLICRSGDQLNIGIGEGFALCCRPRPRLNLPLEQRLKRSARTAPACRTTTRRAT